MVETVIWIAIVVLTGSVLVLERHCLGQMAIVQPLTTCLVAGLVADNVETGCWIGISLQLFATLSGQRADWAIAGVIAAASLVIAPKIGLPPLPVGGVSCLVIALAIGTGIGARFIERRFAKSDGERLRRASPWTQDNPATELAALVHRSIIRWLAMGVVEVTVGVGVAMVVLFGVERLFGVPASRGTVGAIVVPAVGVAVMITSLARYRYIAWAGLTMVLTWIVFL